MIYRSRLVRLVLATVLTVSLAVTPVFALGEQAQTGSASQTSSGTVQNNPQAGDPAAGDPAGGQNGTQPGTETTPEEGMEGGGSAADGDATGETVIQEAPITALASKGGTWTYWQNYDKPYSKITCNGGKTRGIDISVWQGNVDWAKIKADYKAGNLDFVIIRCSHSTSLLDSKFSRNVKYCEDNDIPYGVYLYSTATSTTAARNEANYALKLLKGYHPDLPVYYDMEAGSVLKKTKSKSKITSFARTFCSILDNNGYRAGVYANLKWFDNYIDGNSLKESGYDLWLAQWPTSSKSYSALGHGSKYNVWQVCSCGNYYPSGKSKTGIDWVNGISGRIDLNIMMKTIAEMDAYMTYTELPSTLSVSAAPYEKAYVLSNVGCLRGPGLGYEPTVSHSAGEKPDVLGQANGYIKLADNEWVPASSVVDVNSPKDFVEEEIEGVTKKVLKSYDDKTIASTWATVKGKVYRVDSQGVELTGFQTIAEKDYYLGEDGIARSNQLVTVNRTIEEGTTERVTYYLGTNGLITKNAFVQAGLYRYGFDESGAMMRNCSPWIGSCRYTLDGNGHAYILKAKTKKKASYYTRPGSGKKGTLKKNRSFYVIAKSGSYSQMANGYWIKTSYTKKTAVYPTIKPAVNTSYKAKLKKKTRSYTGPSSGYIKSKNFKKKKKVTVIGTYGSWSKVSTGQWLPSSRLAKY